MNDGRDSNNWRESVGQGKPEMSESNLSPEWENVVSQNPYLFAYGGGNYFGKKNSDEVPFAEKNVTVFCEDFRNIRSGALIYGMLSVENENKGHSLVLVLKQISNAAGAKERGGYPYTLFFDPGKEVWKKAGGNGALIIDKTLQDPELSGLLYVNVPKTFNAQGDWVAKNSDGTNGTEASNADILNISENFAKVIKKLRESTDWPHPDTSNQNSEAITEIRNYLNSGSKGASERVTGPDKSTILKEMPLPSQMALSISQMDQASLHQKTFLIGDGDPYKMNSFNLKFAWDSRE